MLHKILNLFKKKEAPAAVVQDEVKIVMNPPVPFPTERPAEQVAAPVVETPAEPKVQKQAAKPKAAPAAKKTVKAKK
jgi:hypothetical protein